MYVYVCISVYVYVIIYICTMMSHIKFQNYAFPCYSIPMVFHRVALGRDVHVAATNGIGDAQDPPRPL